MWHVSSRSSVATLRTAIHLLLTYHKYAVTLPCNLSLMAFLLTLVFHKVVYQHMQYEMGFLIPI